MHAGVPDVPAGSIIDSFSQYGLSGLVILALFFLVFYFIKEVRAINEMHNERHDKRNELHANERKEWLQFSKESIEINRENTSLLKTLIDKIERR